MGVKKILLGVIYTRNDEREKCKTNCITPAHHCAYILHPTYMDKDLKQKEKEVARQWLVNEVDENFVELMINLMAQVHSQNHILLIMCEIMLNLMYVDQ